MAQGYLHTLIISMVAAVANGIALTQTPGAAGNLTLNGSLVTAGVATMDVARRVIITSAANDSARTFTITGTDRNGRPQTEAVTGANTAAATSKRDFLTVSQIAVDAATAGAVTSGTSGVVSSRPLIIDYFSQKDDIGVTLDFTGTANASIEVARDDLSPTPTNLLAYDFTTASPSWTAPTALASKAALTDATIPSSYTMIRLTQNSFTAPATCIAKIVLPFATGRY